MVKRSGAVLIAANVGIGLSALVIAAVPSAARAQSADLVLCDRLAADPADPDKPADVKGTPEIAHTDIATAIKFCKVASASSRRALYQLGRAYMANQQMPEAVGAYRKAADKGSTSPRTMRRRANCSSAPPRPATRAVPPISRHSPRLTPAARLPMIPSKPEPCSRKRRKQIPRKRSISSD